VAMFVAMVKSEKFHAMLCPVLWRCSASPYHITICRIISCQSMSHHAMVSSPDCSISYHHSKHCIACCRTLHRRALCTTLHYTTLECTILHYTTLLYSTLLYNALHYHHALHHISHITFIGSTDMPILRKRAPESNTYLSRKAPVRSADAPEEARTCTGR
jgi:hypothetical protein